ncbi:DUF2064 domain-containing protein [Pseudooceanicola sp.]|uniref:TIGR04282 family arsenosugar biosynthesis glycosyltransferase n=1 Tax=Pseudooceanicola sp. TaxID=1914328 RepID=UPI0035C67B31
MRRRLVVMVKEPRAGLVKTRLGREIGMIAATWWMRHQLRALLQRLRDPRWDLWLAVSPDTVVASRMFPGDLPRVAQGPGDLGDRMGRVLRRRAPAAGSPDGHAGPRRSACQGGAIVPPSGRTRPSSLHSPGPICIIGADIPGITRHHIWRAFRALGQADAVIGPSTDGGYWLIGTRHAAPQGIFDKVRWSTEHALADTLASLPGLRVALVDGLSDVDEAADL